VPVEATVEAIVVRANQRISLSVVLAPARDD
jgi:hypothetical protein